MTVGLVAMQTKGCEFDQINYWILLIIALIAIWASPFILCRYICDLVDCCLFEIFWKREKIFFKFAYSEKGHF